MNGNGKIDFDKISQYAGEYKAFMDQFKGMFVNRERPLTLMRYALLIRQHILLWGPPGTAKTQICDAIFNGITGAQTFSTELTPYMTEDALFGAYDIKKMREVGILEHRIDGMLPQGVFARFGEILDANPQLLRSLLSALNERRMIRGPQQMQIPLMTAYCDTNRDPAEYLKQNPESWAVLDRVLFMDKMKYLEKPEDVNKMVLRFQRGISKQPAKTISVDVIKYLSNLIVMPPGLIADATIMTAYSNAVQEYRTKRAEMSDEEKALFILPEISDRRVNLASQVIEAEAVLDSRIEANGEDMRAAGLVLCTSDPERELWNKTVEKYIVEHKKTHATQTTTAQGVAITQLLELLERDVVNAPADKPAKEISHTLQVLSKQYSSLAPTDGEVITLHEEGKKRFQEALEKLQERALKETGLSGVKMT